MEVTDHEIEAGAEALRQRQQSGKRLTPWPNLPTATKAKWRAHAACVLTAALSARRIAAKK